MGRPKGSGVLKRIDPAQSPGELWQTLRLGEERVRARHAELFLQWWVGKEKGRGKRSQEFCEALRAALAKDGVAALFALITAVQQLSRPPAHAWQAEVVVLLTNLRLQEADAEMNRLHTELFTVLKRQHEQQLNHQQALQRVERVGEELKDLRKAVNGSLAGASVGVTARQLTDRLRAAGYRIYEDEKTATDIVRRFVTKQLRVKLKADR